MGISISQSERKPQFPTPKQWEDWQQERTNKQEEILKELQNEFKTLDQQREQFQQEVLVDVVEYMRQCQDRSFFSKVFVENSKCTKAKEALLLNVVGVAVNLKQQYDTHETITKIHNKF